MLTTVREQVDEVEENMSKMYYENDDGHTIIQTEQPDNRHKRKLICYSHGHPRSISTCGYGGNSAHGTRRRNL